MLARSGRLGQTLLVGLRPTLGLGPRSSLGLGRRLTLGLHYGLLEHKKMDEVKAKLFGDQQKTFYLKLKFILKQTKYTLVQGSKDLWRDSKWLIRLYKSKPRAEFTGYEIAENRRVIIDLVKFIPYSFILIVPFAEALLPVMLWLFPNAVPSFFLFDTAEDKRIEKLQHLQEDSHNWLLDRLIGVLRELSKNEEQFTHYDSFKNDFFQVIDQLHHKLNYNNFTSDQLIRVLEFLGTPYVTGTNTINKIVNLFTLTLPRLFIKSARYLNSKLRSSKLEPYVDPWWVQGDFKIFRFNYFPFEVLKRRFLIYQIKSHFRFLHTQDEALEKYGMKDIEGHAVKWFARERGFAALTCYDTLKNVLKNDWVKIITHPKFEDNNAKLWYSVMMYKFLAQANKDLN